MSKISIIFPTLKIVKNNINVDKLWCRDISSDGYTVRKALVVFAIESVLLEMGKPSFQKVTEKLFQNYKCYLADCYEHPDYLKKTLQDLYGEASGTIIESIKKQLEGFEVQEGIDSFIKIISV